MSRCAEFGGSLICSREIEVAIEKYKLVKTKTGTTTSVLKTTTGDTYLVYGRCNNLVTATQYTAGEIDVDVEMLQPGTEKTVIAGEAIAIQIPVKPGLDGKVIACVASGTPVDQFSLGYAMEAAAGDLSEFIVHFQPGMITY